MCINHAEVRRAEWVSSLPDGNGITHTWRVGGVIRATYDAARTVSLDAPITDITAHPDLPSPAGMIWRVRVWCGSSEIAEMPLHNVAAVGYLPAAGSQP